MEIQNASTTSSKSNRMRNLNTVRWESGNATTQPWEINNRNMNRDFYLDVYTILNRIYLQSGPYAHFGYWTLVSDP